MFAMINAKELGVSTEPFSRPKPEIKRLVGTAGNFGEQAGLTKDWAVQIVRQVGYDGEVFERNVGTESRLVIPRGLSHLWSTGGILYAPPIR
jgi:general L-amino acid transport system substrate-binding protein